MASNYIQQVKTLDNTTYDLRSAEITLVGGNKNLQIDLINGVAVGTQPKFTDTTYGYANIEEYGLVKLGSNTVQTVAAQAITTQAARTYAVQTNASGQLVVNVPWNAGAETDVNVTQTASSDNKNYEILFSGTDDNTTRTEGARKWNTLKFNPSTGLLTAPKVAAAVYGTKFFTTTAESTGLQLTAATSTDTFTFKSSKYNTNATIAIDSSGSNLTIVKINGQTVGATPKFTDTTYDIATNVTAGLVKLITTATATPSVQSISTATNRTYAVQFNANKQLVVTVPWTDGGITTDEKVKQNNATADAAYEVLLAGSTNAGTVTEEAQKSTKLTFNPDSGVLQATSIRAATAVSASQHIYAGGAFIGNGLATAVSSQNTAAGTRITLNNNTKTFSFQSDDTTGSAAISVASNTSNLSIGKINGVEVGAHPYFTDTTYAVATATSLGLVRLYTDVQQTVAPTSLYSQSDRTYAIQLNAQNQMVVNVPWQNTEGPDTKNTAGAGNSTSKLFLVGAPAQSANPQTYTNTNVYATNGALNASSGTFTNTTTTNFTLNGHKIFIATSTNVSGASAGDILFLVPA